MSDGTADRQTGQFSSTTECHSLEGTLRDQVVHTSSPIQKGCTEAYWSNSEYLQGWRLILQLPWAPAAGEYVYIPQTCANIYTYVLISQNFPYSHLR